MEETYAAFCPRMCVKKTTFLGENDYGFIINHTSGSMHDESCGLSTTVPTRQAVVKKEREGERERE